jgi:hypothetical protein
MSYITETASDMFILSVMPSESLSSEKRKEKISMIHSRNRVLSALYEEASKIKDSSQQAKLLTAIQIIQQFFIRIGGEEEKTISKLSFLNPYRLVEGRIPGSIIISTKPDHLCTKTELEQKEENRKLQHEIIVRAFEKSPNQTIRERIAECIKVLGGTIPTSINAYG